MREIKRICGCLALAALSITPRADAAPLVSVSALPATVLAGDTFSLDIMVSNLTEPLGGFDLSIAWDAAILSLVDATSDPQSNFAGFFAYDAAVAGSLDIGGVGSPIGQNALQLPFPLASMTFEAVGPGTSAIAITFAQLSDEAGSPQVIDPETRGGSVCVATDATAPCVTAPEPATLALASIGLAIAGLRRRRSGRGPR